MVSMFLEEIAKEKRIEISIGRRGSFSSEWLSERSYCANVDLFQATEGFDDCCLDEAEYVKQADLFEKCLF